MTFHTQETENRETVCCYSPDQKYQTMQYSEFSGKKYCVAWEKQLFNEVISKQQSWKGHFVNVVSKKSNFLVSSNQ